MKTESLTLRPTPWFFWRAVLIFGMLAGFGSFFLYDYQVGYPKKNLKVFTYAAFNQAREAYIEKSAAGMSDEQWKEFAAQQVSILGSEKHPLPADADAKFAWPEELQNPDLLKNNVNDAWEAYTARVGWPLKTYQIQEDAKDLRKINEQLYFGAGALALSVLPLFFLIRTQRRKLTLQDGVVTAPDGVTAAISEFTSIDLRKWSNKGLARIEAKVDGESKTLRIDGLTYGGFKKEQGEPAEAFMQEVLKHFNGEIIQFADSAPEEATAEADTPAAEETVEK